MSPRSIVRAGIILVLPFAVLADRIGRRRVVIAMAIGAPVVTALGAFAPTFPALVATQAIGRPLGLALDFLVAVVAAEEMPRSSRAYAISILALASGLGAGIAVMALPLADISAGSWRLVYLVALIWLVVAVDIARRLPETKRFQRPHVVAPRLDRRRFGVLAGVALLTNLFVAPASLFQNGYLKDVRGFNATSIAIFTLVTATPAGVGLMIGGRVADVKGRRRVIAIALPVATVLGVVSYAVGGPAMWWSVFFAGVLGGVTYPALAVYRTELFPTGNRGRAAGLLTAAALRRGHRWAPGHGHAAGPRLVARHGDGAPRVGPAGGGRDRAAVVPRDGPPGAGGAQSGGRSGEPHLLTGVGATFRWPDTGYTRSPVAERPL